MDLKLTSYCLHILILVCVIGANNTSTDGENRQPRGSGRVVKLYSGVRPDPIVCTDEGFRGDPKDCAVFYRCMKSGRGKFTAFRFQCPPGTVYDPDTEVCNHPYSTKRTECGGIIEPRPSHYGVNEIEQINELPSPISTKEPFYSTLSTFKTSVVTPMSPLFTQKPTNAWQSTTSSIHPISTSTKYQELMSHPWSSTTQNHLSFISPIKPVKEQQSNPEDICTVDGFMGDSVNCHKFYRCVGNQHSGFTKFEFSCSEPTIWDDDLKSCNHPWAVKRSRCGRTLDDTEGLNESNKIAGVTTTVKAVTTNANKTIQSQLQIAYGNKVHQTQTQISSNAVIQNQTQINYGDRVHKTKNITNTQNQTQISYGSAVSQSQYQLGYGNEVVQTQVQIDHSKQSSQTQVQIVESTTPTKPNTHQQDVTKTPQNQNNDCSQSGFMGDSSDCNKFYRCVDNGRGGFTRHEFSCGEGTVWDQSIEACNHAWAVKECGGKPSPPVSQESTTKLPLSTTTQSTLTTSKPTEIYVTSTEVAHSSDFEDVGYINNQVTSSSLGPTQSTTEIIHQTGTECKSSGFMGDATNCQIFYSCVENGDGGYTKYEFKCGEGTLWDTDIGGCNHAWAVKRCGENATPTTSKMPSTTTPKLTTAVYLTSPATHMTTQNDDYDTGYGIHKEQSSSTTLKATEVLQDDRVTANNDCKSSGFMGDKNDCKKFYRCVNNGDGSYTRYEFTCGEGTAWDSQIENCNHAWAVDSCKNNSAATGAEPTTSKKPTTIHEEIDHGYNTPEYKDPNISTQKTTPSTTTLKTTQSAEQNKCTKTGFIGDTTDCKKFYRCVDNGDGSFTRYEFSCGQGTVWDQKIEACNHAWAVEKCGAYSETGHEEATTSINSVTMSEEEPVHGYPTPEYPIQNEEVTHKTTQSTTIISTSVILSEYCKKDGFVGDEKDCKKFYRCVNDGRGGFIKYEFECGEGTVWDPNIDACNHAWAVKDCGSRNETVTINNQSTTQSMSSPEHSTEKTSTTTDIAPENEISGDCKTEGFTGDAKDCKIFYRCVDNGQGGFIKYEFKCGEGTYWNQNIQACDHASPDHPCKEYGNNDVTKEPTHVHDETHVETTTRTTTLLTTETQENTPSTKKPQSSDTICSSEEFFGDQNDCQKFYRCVDDGRGGYIKYDFTCVDGTVWDQELLTCARESESNACLTNITASSSPPLKPTQDNEGSFISSTTHVSHPTSTETVYQPQQPPSPDNVPGDLQCTTEGFHANPTDCRKFIRCVNDGKGAFTKYDFACGQGTIWVQEILACDHDDGTASCHSQSNWTSKPQTDFATSTPPNIASSSTTAENPVTNKHEDEYNTEATKAPQVLNEDCHSEGFYANKDDCKKYYRCVSNNNNGYIKYEFVCGEGTAWDANLQTCNHNSVINCQGSSQVENQTESVVHDDISEATESSSTTTVASTTESKESVSSGNEDVCDKEGYFGSTKDCKKFYRCVDNGKGGLTKYDFTCGEGTIWDQDLLTCNYPHDVANPSCKQNTGESSENTTSQPESSTSSTTKTTQSSGTSSTSSSSTTQNSQSTSSSTESSSNCSQSEPPKNSGTKNVTCTKAGYFADPNDCKKFYRCVDWDGNGEKFSVYFFECGEGTIWDPALDTCNHEESVYPPRDCSNSQSQNTSTGPETTTTEQSTTQQSTTTEKSTTETTTSENTTPQTTTSEKTTTEQSTTSEQTTTQQSTTSEKTTTAQSTTSEQTTTQQSTTSETTTTEHTTTTTDGTTTQQAENTTETTTEQATTTEAVKESTTTEKTTTQDTTTISSTTTEESSTTESTTQQTTSEQTTTESGSSTEQTSSTTDSTQQTSTTENQQETTTEHSSSSSCPDTEDDQYLFVCPTSFRRHPKYCNLFYQCTEDDDTHEVKVAVFNCPNNTIYDESKIQCVEENKAEKKCDGEIAARRRVKRLGADYKEPIVVTKDTYKCTTTGHMPFEKNSECSPAFLMCKKTTHGTLRGYVHLCPQNYVYWSISRRCEREETVRDCRRTINNWSGRWEIPIDRQNVAW